MNGAENYAEAERILAHQTKVNGNLTGDGAVAWALHALVHAVQANTAATLATSNRRVTDADDWAQVTG